ncbi:MAG: leucyl/phenylalanyl-tRNA--protein transferase [Burkholderiaceae bacterium]|nr:leucyl/phenylalanyl-tRNA--protein transferase [Burkholderiaceae bacterium]
MRDPDGLLAAGRDLDARRLLEAYRKGVFPWYSQGQPVLWWSPDPRMVLRLESFRITRSLAKSLRRVRRDGRWTVTLNEDFAGVMRACAEPRADQDGTWITADIVAAYCALHGQGNAHSVEVREDGALVGGLYGVSIGRMFYGESMFTRRADASKLALCALVHTLRACGFRMIDCQQNTGHLASLGATQVRREWFLQQVCELASMPAPDWKALAIEWPEV